MIGVTFKPNIQNTESNKDFKHVADKTVLQRNEAWCCSKEAKIKYLAEKYQDCPDCTFTPRIGKLNMKCLQADYSKMNTKSIEKFLDRQLDARQKKEAEKLALEIAIGSGQVW